MKLRNVSPKPMRSTADDVVFKCKKQPQSLYLKYYLTANERLRVIHDAKDAGCLLLEYYFRMASIKETEINDASTAQYFGWSLRKVERTRQKLTLTGWFRAVRFIYSDGRKGITYYLGKEAVAESAKPPPTPAVP